MALTALPLTNTWQIQGEFVRFDEAGNRLAKPISLRFPGNSDDFQ